MKKGINLGNKNNQWKGNKVSYGALHDYIKYHFLKTKLCQCCNLVPAKDCANISGKYKRDLSDWEWLCRKCHMKKDGRYDNFLKVRFIGKKEDRMKYCRYCKLIFISNRKEIFCSRNCSNKSRIKIADLSTL